MSDLPPARRIWFRLTPGRIIVGLLAAECLLWLSDRLRWPAWHKGYAVLTDAAVVGAVLAALLLWWLAALIFRRRFQFSVRALLVLVVAVAVPCSWFASEIRRAKQQRTAVVAILLAEGSVSYDIAHRECIIGANAETLDEAILDQIADDKIRYEPDWVFEALGADYCLRVEKASLGMIYPVPNVYIPSREPPYGRGSDELLALIAESLPDIVWLEAAGPRVTDAGLASVSSMTELRSLSLENTGVTDSGLEKLTSLRKLEGLNLEGTRVTAEGVRRLQKAASQLQDSPLI